MEESDEELGTLAALINLEFIEKMGRPKGLSWGMFSMFKSDLWRPFIVGYAKEKNKEEKAHPAFFRKTILIKESLLYNEIEINLSLVNSYKSCLLSNRSGRKFNNLMILVFND